MVDDDDDLYPEDDNLYSDEEIAAWEKERAGNAKADNDVTFITVHPNGGEGHIIAIDDEKKVVSPNAGDFKGTTLSSAKSMEFDKLDKKSAARTSKKGVASDDADEPSDVQKGTKEYYKAKINKYEKRMKMYAMKMEDLQKRIDGGDVTATEELETYKNRQERVEKKLKGYYKNFEGFKDSPYSVQGISASKSTPIEKPKSAGGSNGTKTDADKLSLKKASSKKLTKTNLGEPDPQRTLKAIPDVTSKFKAEHWDAVDAYQSEDYLEINEALRSGTKVSESTQATIKGLQDAFTLTEPTLEDVVLYRGVDSSFVNSHASWKDTGIISTSPSKEIPTEYAEGGTLMAIRVPKGSRGVLPLYTGGSGATAEEVLLPPGTTFKPFGKETTKRTPDGDMKVLEVEAIVPKSFNFADNLHSTKTKKNSTRKSTSTGKASSNSEVKYSTKELEDAAFSLLGKYKGASFIESFNSNTSYAIGSAKYKAAFVKALLIRKALSDSL